MDNLIPTNFREALGGVLILVSILAAGLSLISNIRSHSLRLAAIFLIGALSLFSNYWPTYFAAIFIIATAVTELEFLQTLAAIIRGNKYYFGYKTKALSHSEKEKNIAKELEELEDTKNKEGQASNPSNVKPDFRSSHNKDIKKIINLESKALDKIEKDFGKKVERNICIRSSNGIQIELDGLISNIFDDLGSEKIIEIKFLKSPNDFNKIISWFPKFEQMGMIYQNITKKAASVYLVIIIESDESLANEQLINLEQKIKSSTFVSGYTIYTTKELSD